MLERPCYPDRKKTSKESVSLNEMTAVENQRKYTLCSPTLRDVINKTVYTDNFTSGKYYWCCKRLISDGRKYKTNRTLSTTHQPSRRSVSYYTIEGKKDPLSILFYTNLYRYGIQPRVVS